MTGTPAAPPLPVRPGRPKADDVERRHHAIVEAAGEAFLRFGFDGTTMDTVAEAARISKRTLYARYPDKAALFGAVLRDLIKRWLAPIDRFQYGWEPLEATLLALARYLTTSALAPQCISISRIIISEAERWPEFGLLADVTGRKPAIEAIIAILRAHQAELRAFDLEMAAEQFMSLAVDSNLRLAYLGITISEEKIEEWVQASVKLFLKGISNAR